MQKHTRLPAVWQVYQRLYYQDKLKAVVDTEYNTYLKSHEGEAHDPSALKKERLSIQNRIMKVLYDQETEEVKAEVERHRKELRNKETTDGPCGEPEKLQE